MDLQMVKIGCIGCGAMGTALMHAVSKVIPTKNLIVSNRTMKKAETFALEHDCVLAKNNQEVIRFADFVFLAIKPIFFPTLIAEIKDEVKSSHTFISMLAGTSIDLLCKRLNTERIIRVMPNTPTQIGEGITAVSYNNVEILEDVQVLLALLEKSGKVEVLDESLFDAFAAVCGCGPAFSFIFAEALADVAVSLGIPRVQAGIFAAQMLKGSAALILETNKHPAVLKDEVCSPAGMTIQGIKALEAYGFRNAIMEAVQAAFNKAKLMSKEY